MRAYPGIIHFMDIVAHIRRLDVDDRAEAYIPQATKFGMVFVSRSNPLTEVTLHINNGPHECTVGFGIKYSTKYETIDSDTDIEALSVRILKYLNCM